MDPKAYWIGFNLVRGIGAVRLQALQDYFASLELAWQAPADALLAAGLPEKVVQTQLQVRSEIDLEKIWDDLQKKDIRILTREDKEYPQRLKEIEQSPPVLYMRGDVTPDDEWAVGIVGTRRMTAYGRQVAEDLALFLAHNGITVISGLARGIDACAHDASLKAGGRTIAVLGSGLDQIYPPENRQLASRIVQSGALISEYFPSTPPESSNFPPRNRIISGLSKAIVVVEAGDTSGALITATFAAEQGREVFAVPGYISAPQSRGSNRLIRDGARILLHPKDVLEALNLEQVQEYKQARLSLPENDTESGIFQILENEALHVDEIQARLGVPIDQISAALVMMELKGMVRQMGGMTYIAVKEQRGTYETN